VNKDRLYIAEAYDAPVIEDYEDVLDVGSMELLDRICEDWTPEFWDVDEVVEEDDEDNF